MKKRHSFTEYVADRFYNEMFSAVKSYAIQNRHSLELYSRVVQNIRYIELSDIKVVNVFVNNQPDQKIAFDVIIDAEIELQDYNRHNDYDDVVSQWFMLTCSGDLACNLDDFQISSVSVFNKRNFHEKPMSDALVPFIHKEDLEDFATEFLQAHYPEALNAPMYLEPMELAKRMNLDVQLTRITKELSVFGASFFKDCETEYYDEKSDSMKPISIKAGTIFVDREAYYLRNLGSVNNTIVHECVHWHFHQKAFALERLYNDNASQIKCQVIGGVKDTNERSATDWMEWQANSPTPRIQMPLNTFKIKAQELIRKYRKKLQTFELVDVIEPVIRELATFYGVSNCAAKIRMIDAGYDEAIGVMTYIDGRYVKPHTFKKNSISKKQTFSISREDALIQSVFSPKLREDLKDDKYKYIDAHFVFNSPKYITTQNGEPCLTEYARLHIDECCLIFDLKVKSVNKYGETYYTECVLFRDSESNIVFEAKYSDDNKEHKSQAEIFKKYSDDVLSVIKSLPNSFPDALDKVIDWSDMTEEEISEAADISTRHIQRLRNDAEQNVTMETVMQLCIGMKLPTTLSYALIDKSGNSFRANDKDFAYQFLLTSYSNRSLYECNEFLDSLNLPLLGRTAKEMQKNEKN